MSKNIIIENMLQEDNESRLEDFLTVTAADIISGLNDDDKQFLLENPDYIDHHFGFGLWIRNTYIHGQNLPIVTCQPDDLSALIFDKVIRMLQEEKGVVGKADQGHECDQHTVTSE